MVPGPKHAGGQFFLYPLTPRVKVKPLNQFEKNSSQPLAGKKAGDTPFPKGMWGLCRECVETSVSLGAKVIFSWLGPLASALVSSSQVPFSAFSYLGQPPRTLSLRISG